MAWYKTRSAKFYRGEKAVKKDEPIAKEKSDALVYLQPIADELGARMEKLIGKSGACSEMIADATREGCRAEWFTAINHTLKPSGMNFPYDDVRAALRRLQHMGSLSFLDKLPHAARSKAA
ncbi:MAG: hypothetical protein WAZ27_03510 [Minisyncoccia bacterium]